MTGKSTVKEHPFRRNVTLLCRRVEKGYVIECAYISARSAGISAANRNKEALRLHVKDCEKRGLDWDKHWKGEIWFTKKVSVRDYG